MRDLKPRSRRMEKDLANTAANAKDCPTPSKNAYPRKGPAKKAAKTARLNVYKCTCGYYHLTSRERRPVLR